MIIRKVTETDLNAWTEMRSELWPESKNSFEKELAEFFAGTSIDIVDTFVIELESGALAGFIELNIRNFAEGSRESRVPYVEGWFVRADSRGKGYGLALMQRAEQWAKEGGFAEIASDTELDNERSITLHKKFGYEETERVVCFLKKLEYSD